MQDARGRGTNYANAVLLMNKSSTTGQSIDAAGSINASGSDNAEYIREADGCGVVAKGQIVGIDSNGHIADRWALGSAFATKSVDPSYVGGAVWHTDPRPAGPALLSPDADKATLARHAYECLH